MHQLVSDRCGVILLNKGDELDVVTMASIQDRLGVGPSQVPFFLALTEKNRGDPVLAQKQAVRILELHGTLETVLNKAAAGDLGQLGRKLVTRSDTLRERCRELEFRAPAHQEMKGSYAET